MNRAKSQKFMNSNMNSSLNCHSGLKFCDFDHKRLRRSADDDQVVKTSRVVSGTTVDGYTVKMPWVVRLEFTPTTGNVVRCAGTVVHKNWILTTQECCQVSYWLIIYES